MAALNSIGFPVGAPPPDIPNLPGASPALVDYLRRQNTWINQQLQNKVPMQAAVNALYLLSPNGTTYMLQALNNGNVTITPVVPGSTPP